MTPPVRWPDEPAADDRPDTRRTFTRGKINRPGTAADMSGPAEGRAVAQRT